MTRALLRSHLMRAYDVLYDGGCGLCSRTVIWLRRLDLRRRLRFVDFDCEWDRLSTMYPSLDRDACAEAMHVIDPRGRTTAGFDAFRTIARVVPPFWPILPFLYVPGIPPIGRRVYAYVARHRSTQCVLPAPGRTRHAPDIRL
jgi:predicted DCC family thiol-disulfide oxidoreductase YuxK